MITELGCGHTNDFQESKAMNQDKARECAEELTGYLVRCGIIEEDDAATLSDTTYDFTNLIAKHFPPSVPVSKLKALKRHAANVDGGYIESADLDALIAEAEKGSTP